MTVQLQPQPAIPSTHTLTLTAKEIEYEAKTDVIHLHTTQPQQHKIIPPVIFAASLHLSVLDAHSLSIVSELDYLLRYCLVYCDMRRASSILLHVWLDLYIHHCCIA